MVFLEDRGDIKFIIVCMPYINERLIVDQDCKNIELHNDVFLKNLEKAYKDQISNVIGALDEQYLHIPRILIAHSFFLVVV